VRKVNSPQSKAQVGCLQDSSWAVVPLERRVVIHARAVMAAGMVRAI
jgi:hypothetical protein